MFHAYFLAVVTHATLLKTKKTPMLYSLFRERKLTELEQYSAPKIVSSPASNVDAKVNRLVGCLFGDSQSIYMLPVGNEAVEC